MAIFLSKLDIKPDGDCMFSSFAAALNMLLYPKVEQQESVQEEVFNRLVQLGLLDYSDIEELPLIDESTQPPIKACQLRALVASLFLLPNDNMDKQTLINIALESMRYTSSSLRTSEIAPEALLGSDDYYQTLKKYDFVLQLPEYPEQLSLLLVASLMSKSSWGEESAMWALAHLLNMDVVIRRSDSEKFAPLHRLTEPIATVMLTLQNKHYDLQFLLSMDNLATCKDKGTKTSSDARKNVRPNTVYGELVENTAVDTALKRQVIVFTKKMSDLVGPSSTASLWYSPKQDKNVTCAGSVSPIHYMVFTKNSVSNAALIEESLMPRHENDMTGEAFMHAYELFCKPYVLCSVLPEPEKEVRAGGRRY